MLFLVCALYPLTLALLYGAAVAHNASVEGLEWLRAAILLLFLPILGKYLAHLAIAPWYGLVERLRSAGVHFRSDIIQGTGGNQALVEDPSGKPIELFQPLRPEARLSPTT